MRRIIHRKEENFMNLLTIAKKRTVTKVKDDGIINIQGEKHLEYFDYQHRVTTSHLDSRELVASDVPGSRTVGSMDVSDILSNERH